jgi:hypothetical protein
VLAVAAVLAAIAVHWSGSRHHGAPPAAGVPQVIAAAATKLGALRHPCYVIARDNGSSAAYHGVSYWVFGDGFYGSQRCERRSRARPTLVSSALGWTTQRRLRVARSTNIDLARWRDLTDDHGDLRELLPLTADERRFNARHTKCARLRWDDPYGCYARIALFSSSIIADPARDRLIVFFGQVCRRLAPPGVEPVVATYRQEANCGSPWSDRGQSIAVVRMSPGREQPVAVERPTIAHAPDPGRPTLLWPDRTPEFTGPSRPHFASPVVVDGQLYAYSACPAVRRSLTCRLVARVALANVLDAAKWRYLSGTTRTGRPRWTSDVGRAVGVNGGGGSTAWVPYLRAYLSIAQAPWDPARFDQVFYQVSPRPWGPWSPPRLLFKGVRRPKRTRFGSYGANLHPEFAQRDGRIQYITYCVPGALTGSLQLVQVAFTAKASE